MSDGVKVMAIGCLSLVFAISILVIPENTNLLWGEFAALCSTIGIPVVVPAIGRKIKK